MRKNRRTSIDVAKSGDIKNIVESSSQIGENYISQLSNLTRVALHSNVVKPLLSLSDVEDLISLSESDKSSLHSMPQSFQPMLVWDQDRFVLMLRATVLTPIIFGLSGSQRVWEIHPTKMLSDASSVVELYVQDMIGVQSLAEALLSR